MNVGNVAHTSLEQMTQPNHQPHIGMQLRSDTSQNGAAQPLRELLHAPLLHSASQPLPQDSGGDTPIYSRLLSMYSTHSADNAAGMIRKGSMSVSLALVSQLSCILPVFCTQHCKLLLRNPCTSSR